MPSLAGKTLFITGASRGIGLAIAVRAARDGANVAIAAKSDVANPKLPGTIHTAAAAVTGAGGQGLALKCDIREEDQVRADGSPGIIDFQLAVRGHPRSRWLRLLAREDLRHLLKHKRTYCPDRITAVERRVLRRTSWLREAWFATGKPVYRFVTRRILHWEDNEGQGPKP